MTPPKLIFGIFEFDKLPAGAGKEILNVASEGGIGELDCGVVYENCEGIVAALGGPQRFICHGKADPSRNKKEQVLQAAETSLKDLGLKDAPKGQQFDGYYLHAPDPTTPIEESCEAIQQLYEAGVFKRFGLSNFLAEDVQRIHDYNSARGYVLPELYQGNYNALQRRCEKDLMPTLRRLGMSFYCYSPLGGGYYTTTPATIKEGRQGRFDTADGTSMCGLVFQAMFVKPSYLRALDAWTALAARSGLAPAELATRWINHHSALRAADGDGIIVGADTPDQLRELLAWRAKGPLPPDVVAEIDAIWASCEHEASLDCVNGWFEDIKMGRIVPPEGLPY